MSRVRQQGNDANHGKILGAGTGHGQSAPEVRIRRVAQIVQATTGHQAALGHQAICQTGKRQSRQFDSPFWWLRPSFGNLPTGGIGPEIPWQMVPDFVENFSPSHGKPSCDRPASRAKLANARMSLRPSSAQKKGNGAISPVVLVVFRLAGLRKSAV